MNIYLISWLYSENFELNAVVIDNDEESAINQLGFDKIDYAEKYISEVKCLLIGIATENFTQPVIVCREEL